MITLLHGDCREVLATLPAGSVQCVITSPPYYGLRAYSDDPREIGRETTPAEYVAALVAVFDEVKRVLREDGVLWVNLGDSYAPNWTSKRPTGGGGLKADPARDRWTRIEGIAPKNLLGMPWRVAFALQDAGWILRSDIIWSKPNPMPESVTDRPTRAHEYLFLFAKQQRYYYDADAIREPHADKLGIDRFTGKGGVSKPDYDPQTQAWNGGGMIHKNRDYNPAGRNRRSVWTIATQPYAGAHFATMPEALIEPCVLAGSASQACETCGAAWGRVVEREGESSVAKRKARGGAAYNGAYEGSGQNLNYNGAHDQTARPIRDLGFAPRCACATNTGAARSIVLDPFAGSGTVMRVAERFGRDAIGIDLNAEYLELQEKRTDGLQVELFT